MNLTHTQPLADTYPRVLAVVEPVVQRLLQIRVAEVQSVRLRLLRQVQAGPLARQVLRYLLTRRLGDTDDVFAHFGGFGRKGRGRRGGGLR